MGTIKAICIKQYKQLEGVLDLGDIVDIVSILSTEPKVIVKDWYMFINPKNSSEGRYLAAPKVVAPVGSFEGFSFLSKNGNTYTDYNIHLALGYYNINNIFAKV